MAHTGIFATSDEILVKAGEYYDTSITEARINALCLQCESIINCACRYNFSDAYAGLNADVKGILSALESSWVAMNIIQFNMEGFAGLGHATTMLDFLHNDFTRNLAILREKYVQDFVTGA